MGKNLAPSSTIFFFFGIPPSWIVRDGVFFKGRKIASLQRSPTNEFRPSGSKILLEVDGNAYLSANYVLSRKRAIPCENFEPKAFWRERAVPWEHQYPVSFANESVDKLLPHSCETILYETMGSKPQSSQGILYHCLEMGTWAASSWEIQSILWVLWSCFLRVLPHESIPRNNDIRSSIEEWQSKRDRNLRKNSLILLTLGVSNLCAYT